MHDDCRTLASTVTKYSKHNKVCGIKVLCIHSNTHSKLIFVGINFTALVLVALVTYKNTRNFLVVRLKKNFYCS